MHKDKYIKACKQIYILTLSLQSTSAPFSKSRLTISIFPFDTAMRSGVLPFCIHTQDICTDYMMQY